MESDWIGSEVMSLQNNTRTRGSICFENNNLKKEKYDFLYKYV